MSTFSMEIENLNFYLKAFNCWMSASNSSFLTEQNTPGLCHLGASLVVQMVKNLPAIQETWVRSLGQEDPLAKKMATHSSVLAWRIPIDRGAWWATVHGVRKNGHD